MKKLLSILIIAVFAFTSMPLMAEATTYKKVKTHSYKKRGSGRVHSHYRKVATGKGSHSNYRNSIYQCF